MALVQWQRRRMDVMLGRNRLGQYYLAQKEIAALGDRSKKSREVQRKERGSRAWIYRDEDWSKWRMGREQPWQALN